jgi:hypothetical protein
MTNGALVLVALTILCNSVHSYFLTGVRQLDCVLSALMAAYFASSCRLFGTSRKQTLTLIAILRAKMLVRALR